MPQRLFAGDDLPQAPQVPIGDLNLLTNAVAGFLSLQRRADQDGEDEGKGTYNNFMKRIQVVVDTLKAKYGNASAMARFVLELG